MMWKDIDLDEAFRRITLIAAAILAPLFKFIEFADDRLPTPVVMFILIAPCALVLWLPVWVFAVPLTILFLSFVWMLVAWMAVASDPPR